MRHRSQGNRQSGVVLLHSIDTQTCTDVFVVEIFLFSLRWIKTSGSKIIITILLKILNRLTVLINRSHLITVSVIMIKNCVLISFLR